MLDRIVSFARDHKRNVKLKKMTKVALKLRNERIKYLVKHRGEKKISTVVEIGKDKKKIGIPSVKKPTIQELEIKDYEREYEKHKEKILQGIKKEIEEIMQQLNIEEKKDKKKKNGSKTWPDVSKKIFKLEKRIKNKEASKIYNKKIDLLFWDAYAAINSKDYKSARKIYSNLLKSYKKAPLKIQKKKYGLIARIYTSIKPYNKNSKE